MLYWTYIPVLFVFRKLKWCFEKLNISLTISGFSPALLLNVSVESICKLNWNILTDWSFKKSLELSSPYGSLLWLIYVYYLYDFAHPLLRSIIYMKATEYAKEMKASVILIKVNECAASNKAFTFSCTMLQNGQTFFKNLAVFTGNESIKSINTNCLTFQGTLHILREASLSFIKNRWTMHTGNSFQSTQNDFSQRKSARKNGFFHPKVSGGFNKNKYQIHQN